MQEIYSSDLIRFYYHETSSAENKAIIASLQANSERAEDWENLRSTLNELTTCEVEPDSTSVKIIMEYSQKTGQKLEV